MNLNILKTDLDGAFKPKGRKMISLVGAGGKSSLMYSLAKIFSARGEKVLCSTSTKILKPSKKESPRFELMAHLDDFFWEESEKSGYLSIGSSFTGEWETPHPKSPEDLTHLITATEIEKRKEEEKGDDEDDYGEKRGKIKGYSPEELRAFWEKNKDSKLIDKLIIEADGAAQRYLKIPNKKEPAVPANTDIYISIMNMRAFCQPLSEDWVWRSELFSALSGLATGEKINIPSLLKVICHPEGSFKNSDRASEKILFLNGLDLPLAEEKGLALARALFQKKDNPAHKIVMGSAANPKGSSLCIQPN